MKYNTIDQYAPDTLDLPQRALLTAWGCLSDYHDDLVLVGGLAVKYLTKTPATGQPGPVTQDVDFGISLGAESGMYGSIRETLATHGFQWAANRFVRKLPDLDLYVDLLADHGKETTGSVVVDDGLNVSIAPGIKRALEHARTIQVTGKSLVGAIQTEQIRVAEVGPMMVLKLNAFGGRKAGKDVHDLLYLAMNCHGGADHAINAFHEEKAASNRGMPNAMQALTTYFSHADALGPMSCAAFRLNNRHEHPDHQDDSERIREQCVTLATALLS